MNIFVIGTPADVRGFRLAGVPGFVCDSRDVIDRRLDEILRTDPDAIVIFSGAASELVADRCARWRRDGTGPAFEVLPR